ncbi:MAG: DNA polymerase domain-containing protein [Desulfurococcaceae archaeon]
MSNKWLLNATIREDKVILTLYDEEAGSLEEKDVNLFFHGYLMGKDPVLISRELNKLDGVENAWIEKWRAPSFHDAPVDVVVYRTRSYRLLMEIAKSSLIKGIKVVNTFPHPLVEALYRAKIRPLTRIKTTSGNEQEWMPFERDPGVNYVVLGFENGYFMVKTRSKTLYLRELEDIVNYIVPEKFHLGFADPYVYTELIKVEPAITRSAYIWITGGAFDPSEYFEWSRLSYTPLSLMNNITIGKILTTIEALYARDRRILVDKTHGRREPWRTMRQLLINDRGGVVYQPKPGLYWNVCQVDFKSLYPSIMVKYNVSGETVDKTNCSRRTILPWTPHSVCFDEEGVVPASIKKLIYLKDLYDELFKKTGEHIYEYRKKAIKWILVASFGYLGYRNSLFGSVMAHEVVTSTSREIMRQAKIVAEKEGYGVIHIIVDSIFVTGISSSEECEYLKEKIEKKTGFKAKVEAHYTWLYIPRSLNYERSVANKYYGLLSDGSFKLKGIMAVRKDTPLLVKRAQLEALGKLMGTRSPLEMVSSIQGAHEVIDYYVEKLKRSQVDPYELIISRFSRVRESYLKPPSYISKTNPPYRLVYVDGKLVPFNECSLMRIDVDKYVWLLEKARSELPRERDLGNVPKIY